MSDRLRAALAGGTAQADRGGLPTPPLTARRLRGTRRRPTAEQLSPPRGKLLALTARAGLADEGRVAAPRRAASDAAVRAAVLRSLDGAGPAAAADG